jgi:hypothetical protein
MISCLLHDIIVYQNLHQVPTTRLFYTPSDISPPHTVLPRTPPVSSHPCASTIPVIQPSCLLGRSVVAALFSVTTVKEILVGIEAHVLLPGTAVVFKESTTVKVLHPHQQSVRVVERTVTIFGCNEDKD